MIPSLLFAYRNVPNEISGLTPAMLVFGRNCRNGLDVMYDRWSGKDVALPKLCKSDLEFLTSVQQNLKVAQDIASAHSKPLEKAYIDRYNLKAREKSFEVGTQVLVLMPDSSSKMKSRWQGPYVVSKKLTDYSYLIASLEDTSVRVLHANKLREFTPRVEMIGVIESCDSDDFGEIIDFPLSHDEFTFIMA